MHDWAMTDSSLALIFVGLSNKVSNRST